MTSYYVSKNDVYQAIEYFKALNINNDAMLPAYLLAKSLGITLTRPIKFVNLNQDQKDEILKVIWQMGGLQGKNETGKKRSVLFPNAFKSEDILSNDFYQAGTEFNGLVGRIKDTVEKKNINVSLFVDNKKQLTLSRKYKEIIKEKYLNDEKISLKHFACWVYRFVDFDFRDAPNNIEFSRVISKAIRNLFKISKNDFLWLFEDDILSGSITPSTEVIPASDIRKTFTYQEGNEPVIEPASYVNAMQDISISKNQVEKFIQLTGDNPTNEQIYNTLLQTKQIVLTGVPGVGKTRFLNDLKDRFYYSEMIQFHANYSYEEFIGGDTIENSTIRSKKGKFLKFIERAKSDESKNYLFIIDELNRGNIAHIFGETILTLDRGYTADLPKTIEGTTDITIPDNLYIACSMNSSDRNVAFLDIAIRRRFAFIELHPNYELLSSITTYAGFDLGNVLKTINTRILNVLGKNELLLGHSYILSNYVKEGDKFIWTDETFHHQFNFVILPTLREYTFSNENALITILGEPLSTGLIELDDFMEAFEEEFGKH